MKSNLPGFHFIDENFLSPLGFHNQKGKTSLSSSINETSSELLYKYNVDFKQDIFILNECKRLKKMMKKNPQRNDTRKLGLKAEVKNDKTEIQQE